MRFRNRFAQQSIADHIEAWLVSLGWTSNPAPFGTIPVTFTEVEPQFTEKVAPNTVSTTLGDEGEYEAIELGGVNRQVILPVFVDVFAVNTSIAMSIASDIREGLHERTIPLVNYSLTPVENTTETIEFEDVVVERPDAVNSALDFKRYWRAVKCLAYVNFVEELV